MIKMKNLLTENMKRFGTKNLNEQDFDQNNNGYPDETEQLNTPAGSDSNFEEEIDHAKALIQNKMDIADNAKTSRDRLIEVLSSMENFNNTTTGTYADYFDFESMGFNILELGEGPHGFLYLNTSESINPKNLRYDQINENPEFQKFFKEISSSGNRNNFEIQVQIKN